MKKYIILIFCLLLCLFLLAGCACEHTWIDADCTTAKTCASCGVTEGEPLGHTWVEANCTTAQTCSICGTTEGEPLGHTIAKRQENPDAITAIVTEIQYCSVCNEQIASQTVPLETMLNDGMFLFTPNEFVKRLAVFTDKYVHTFSCEFELNDLGLAAFVIADEREIVLQFFGRDCMPLTAYDLDSPEVWCVSLIQVGEKDEKLRQSFLMACDPALDKDTVYRVNVGLTAASMHAIYAGELFAYTQYNGLLYEVSGISDELLGETFAMDILNVYASDFRNTEPEVVTPSEGIL